MLGLQGPRWIAVILILVALAGVGIAQSNVVGQPVTTNPLKVGSVNIGGTVAAGGTYQTVAVASLTRNNCTIQNPTTASEVLQVAPIINGSPITQPYTLSAGWSFSTTAGGTSMTDPLAVTAATTGHAFTGTCQ